MTGFVNKIIDTFLKKRDTLFREEGFKMRTQKYNLQGIKVFFYILMIAILGWFLCMQFFGANEQENDVQSQSPVYTGTFYWEKEDGSKQKINLPGSYEIKPGHTMILSTTLPEDYDATSFAIRSSLQDVKFYVGDELRTEYSTKDTRLAGKNSASRYIFCPTTYRDAGKTLRIELTTYTSNYSGVVNEIYCGSQAEIWQYIYNDYGISTFIAFFILFAGITSIIFGSALKFTYHTTFSMEYLGWCMVMGATWMLGESKIRQILVPNASALAALCFVMIMLSPLPLLFYADSIQNGKHRKLYKYIGCIALLNFAVSSILYLAKVKDYIEALPVAQCILICVFILVFIHLCQYIRKYSHSRSDYFLLFGLFLVLVCIAIESISVYFVAMISGIFIGIGMIVLLLTNIARTIHRIQLIEQTRHQKELDIEKKENKKMNEVRIKVMKGYKDNKASDEYYLLKKFNWLLFKNPEDEDKHGRLFDVERERKYNSHFKSYMNYYDLRKKLLDINNDLTICYSLKLELVDFYSKSTIDNAKVNLENLIRSCIDTNIDEMIAFSNNLINWKQEIINSFTIVGTEYKVEADKGQVVVCNKKVNNAIIENRNKIIKCIKNNANGYTNWSRFRNRVMYVLDPNTTFSLEPREK